MLERQIVNFAKAVLLLHTIKADKNRLDLVVELQRFLIRRITQCERRTYRVKKTLLSMRRSLSRDRLPKAHAAQVKIRIGNGTDVIEALRHMMFLWRSFGDGIAAIYQNKYALKHLFYDATYKIKEDPGHMTGKAGFRREWRFLNLGISMGVPVVLADVTNIIRHGDLCGLAGPDPVPVEVKSSKNRNARTARQFGQLDELAGFYANDGADDFRGQGSVQRVELRFAEVNHTRVLNDCVAEALVCGVAIVEPEPGLQYIAFSEGPEGKLERPNLSTVQAYVLGASPGWLPAYPFTLSLAPANLVRFFLGQVAIMVLIDLAVVKSLFKHLGVHATMLMDSNYSMQICNDPGDLSKGVVRISQSRFSRIAAEFQSLKWFVEELAHSMEDFLPAKSEAEQMKMVAQPIPADWYTVRDCFESSDAQTDQKFCK